MKHLLSASLAAVTLASCATGAWAEVANTPKVLALSANIDLDTFDRAAIRVGTREPYWMAVFDTLVHLTSDAQLKPGMATEWAWNDTNDALTFTLRDGIKFTDGSVFDAKAVKANLLALRDGGGENAFMVSSIADVEIKSDRVVVLHLSQPDPSLLESLSTAGGVMASPASIGASSSSVRPIGSGAYILDEAETVPGRQYVYVRNPHYWDAASIEFETLTITPIADLSARLNAIRSKQIDAALGDASVVAEAEASGLNVTSYPVDWEGINFMDRDGTLIPALADVRVRQAINMAIDKASILKFMRSGHGQVTSQIFGPSESAYVAELDGAYTYDREKARALMAEAGYADGFKIILPELRLFSAFTPVISQMLGEIGITSEWVPVAPTEAVAELQSGKFAIAPTRLAALSSWSDIRRVVAPDATWNVFDNRDPALDTLIRAAQYAPTPEQQVAGFQAINKWLVGEAWFSPWYRIDTILLTNGEVTVTPRPGSVAPSPQYFKLSTR